MPLFRPLGELAGGGAKARPGERRVRKIKFKGKTDEDGSVLSLTRLCLLSLADNMKEVWVKDYADNYMNRYCFMHIMGPFNLLPGELIEELTRLLCTRKQLTRAALHLLLVPQLRSLSLKSCPGLVNCTLCPHIAARCQGLWTLDLSGAQQLPSKVLSVTLCSLPDLRSLSLAGTPCDRSVIRAIAHRCRLLRHLDVSGCHFLSPAALLLLACGASFSSPDCHSEGSSSSQSSCSLPLTPLPLTSLLALDIGFGEQEGDPAAAAAYLLLSLPYLERVAMEGLSQALCLIQHQEFDQTDQFAEREGVPRFGELLQEWRRTQGMDSWNRKGEDAAEDEQSIVWEEFGSESEEDENRDEGPRCCQNQGEEKRRARVLNQSGDERLMLRLKDVKGLSCDSLDSLCQLCPNICSISVNVGDDEDIRARSKWSLLATGLNTWTDQLQSLSVHYCGPLVDLLPALQVVGSSLLAVTLEGVNTSPHTPMLELIKACPRLRELFLSAEPPATPRGEEVEEEQRGDWDLLRLPNLRSLTFKFSYEHSQMKPAMSWMSLRQMLKCLLIGSPLLEKLTLVSLPCPLNSILQDILHRGHLDRQLLAYPSDILLMPLGRVQYIELPRTDVTITTVKSIMLQSKRLEYVNVSHCWQINHFEWMKCQLFSKVVVVWL